MGKPYPREASIAAVALRRGSTVQYTDWPYCFVGGLFVCPAAARVRALRLGGANSACDGGFAAHVDDARDPARAPGDGCEAWKSAVWAPKRR